jgi:hypothetical protein
MNKATPILTNFSAGEIDPCFYGRVDLAQYFNACRMMENAVVLTLGGAEKRPGTYFVAEAKDSTKKIRLVPFKFSTTQEYILEFGDKYIRYYKDRGQIVSAGAPVETVTTYLESELFDLKFTQSADTLYIAHPSHPPAKLTRTSHTEWTLSDITFTAAYDAWVTKHYYSTDDIVVNDTTTYKCTISHTSDVFATDLNAGKWIVTDALVTPFVGTNNYPSCVAFFEERLAWAATNNEPITVWLSKSGDFENMTTGALDDSALKFTINADGVNRIRWMIPQNFLFLGTVDAEWRFGGATPSDAITPSSVNAKRQSANGSNNVSAILVGDIIIYVQYHGRKVLQFNYTLETDSYVSSPLTKLARHITEGKIINIAYQQEPDPIVWFVRGDGVLLSMTYYISEKVVAWSRHITDGKYESVAVIHGPDEDEVWTSVLRGNKRTIEYFMPREFGNKEDAFFVDCGLTFDGGDWVQVTGASQTNPVVITYTGNDPVNGWEVYITDISGMDEINGNTYIVANVNTSANTFELSGIDGTAYGAFVSGGKYRRVENKFSGLNHLEGKTVDVCVDGAAHTPCEVVNGEITLDSYYNKIHAGLHYEMKLQPMKLEVQSMTGSSQAKIKRIEALTVRFYNTIGCKAGETEDEVKDLIFGENAELFSGDISMEFKGDYGLSADIFFLHDQPLPCTIISIMPELAVYDRN